ncbi:MAG: serine/threonine protein kinase, partial [Myxococcales bacterium]|nr:serine/threonine protein kinase [Myxococcales bacterium]
MMNLAVIHDPTESLPARGPATGADARVLEGATSTTVNALEPRERVRGLVAARLFGAVARPSRVDRFELQRELGVGGMGAVYAAHDPRLDRVVALKILQRAGGGVEAGQRLLREAQAMARLRHPNVVQVYEAGTHGGQVYIAMELIEGGTLGEWMRGRPRPWREVREVMLAAGRGLAAAHAAGLVHRDFKPGNVLMDVDGQPRVSDFGLARGAEEEEAVADEAEVTAEISRGGLLDVVLTRTGAVLGTPAYMSPEQFRGEPTTPRSDQFAFCVVVWEALAGQRPFVAETAGGLLAKVEAGAITRPRGVRIPRRVRRILERGMSPAPGDRFPSMKALLAELGRVRYRHGEGSPRAWIASAMAASMILGVAVLDADSEEEARADATELSSTTGGSFIGLVCAQEQRELAAAWSPEVADGLRARLTAAAQSVGAADLDVDASVAAIDRRFVALRDATEARCTERIAAPESRADLVDLCLEDRRTAFTDMLASLEGASPMEMMTLEGLVSMVPDVSECALERPPRSSTGKAAARAERWQARRKIAWAFAPRALARDVIDPSSWTDAITVANLYDDRRLAYEGQLAGAIALSQISGIAVAPGTGWAQTLDRMSATDGYREQLDVQARARALLLELDERA